MKGTTQQHTDLFNQLDEYARRHTQEKHNIEQTKQFLSTRNPTEWKKDPSGHITGSAWLMDPGTNAILLTLHKKHRRWYQLGGHMEQENHPTDTAHREAQEESGICNISMIHSKIFHLGIYQVPATNSSPAHTHYDFCYLFKIAPTAKQFKISSESLELKWFSLAELTQLPACHHVEDIVLKWLHFRQTTPLPIR